MFVRDPEVRIMRELNRTWNFPAFHSPNHKAQWILQREQNKAGDNAVQNALQYVESIIESLMSNVQHYRAMVQQRRKNRALTLHFSFMFGELQNSVHYWKLVKWHIQRLSVEWQSCPACKGTGIASVAEQDATLEVTFCPACNGYGKTSPNYVATLDGVRVIGERNE